MGTRMLLLLYGEPKENALMSWPLNSEAAELTSLIMYEDKN